jgi:HlyD family secretion protein
MSKTDMHPDVETVLAAGRSGRTSRFVRFLAAAIVITGAVAIGWMWLAGGAKQTVGYTSTPAARGNLVVVVTATGSVQPTNLVEVSSELSGTIRSVLVDYNSTVKQGQVLAELDTDKLEAEVEAARANLSAAQARVANAEATLQEARADYDRKQALAGRNVASTYDLEKAKATYERAVAALAISRADADVAKSDLKLKDINLTKACICSPIDGVVLSRSVDPGQTVAATLQAPVLFEIAEDLKEMEVQVDVDEADIGALRDGQHSTFTVDAYPDQTFSGTVRVVHFGSEVVQGVVTYKVILTTDNSAMLLRPGMTATADITVREVTDALLVPNAALRFTPPLAEEEDTRSLISRLLPGPPRFREASRDDETAGRRVWVLRDGAPVAVLVETGATDGARTEITGGNLSAGDQVIVDSETTER